MALSKLPTHIRLSDYRHWLTEVTSERHREGDFKNDMRDTNENRKRYIQQLNNAVRYNDHVWLEQFASHVL